MNSKRLGSLLAALGLLAGLASAQFDGTFSDPAVIGFVDISATGTALTGIADDTLKSFTSTVGNSMFPAGPVTVSNNGFAIAGIAQNSSAAQFYDNVMLPFGPPSDFPQVGTGYVFPFWDDLFPTTTGSNSTIYWQELNDVLYIMWKNETLFDFQVDMQVVTFEVQVFANPGPCAPSIQFLYPDSVFGGSGSGHDNGASATVGYAGGILNIFVGFTAQMSFNTASEPTGTVVSFIHRAHAFTAHSMGGPGTLNLEWGDSPCLSTIMGGKYLLAITLHEGNYPSGWLFGVDIPPSDLVGLITFGPPFVNDGEFFLMGFGGLPSLTFYAVVLNFHSDGVLAQHSNALSHTIP